MASTYTWTLQSGSIPPGTSLSLGETDLDITLTGTPTTTGVFNFVVRITNNISGAFDDQAYSVTIIPAPAGPQIVTSSLPNGIDNIPYNSPVYAVPGVDYGPFTWSLDAGSLPSGLSLDTAEIDLDTSVSGIPTTPGSYNFTVKIEDSASGSDTQPYLVLIGNDLGILKYRVSWAQGAGATCRLYVSLITGGDQDPPLELANRGDWALYQNGFALAGQGTMNTDGEITFQWTENAHLEGRLQAIILPTGSLGICTNSLVYPANP